ncbi:MAG: tetratricopeptide repeat protein [bacterium]|nr:tetratricopeptide repeat protein [bacterium]
MYLISKPWILRLRRAPLDLPILAFLCAFLLSFAATDDRSAAFFGVSSRWETGLLALFLFICWYMLLTQYIGRRVMWTKERDWKILLVGLTVLIAFGIMLVTSSGVSVLSWRESWNVVFGTLFSDIKHLFLGSGPGTLFLDATKLGFTGKGLPWIAETLATTGVVGLLGHLLLFLASGVFALHLFRKTKGASAFSLFFIAWCLMLLAFFFVPFSPLVAVLFWTLLATLGVPSSTQRLFLKLEHSFLKLAFAGLVLAFLGVTGAASVVLAWGEIAFVKNNAEVAAKVNPWMPEYQIASSKLFLTQLQQEIEKPVAQQDKKLLSFALQQALSYGKRAAELSPARSEAWKQVGNVYMEMEGVPGALGWAVKALEEATRLEPKNPDYRADLGILYAKQDKVEEARFQLEQALLLDSRHKEARKQLALLAEHEGDTERAYAAMRETALLFPEDGDILFQLGRMEYNRGNAKAAIELFERVIAAAPSDSNARYALAVALEKEGRKEEALQHFEKVLLLNPDNDDVRKKIEILQQ